MPVVSYHCPWQYVQKRGLTWPENVWLLQINNKHVFQVFPSAPFYQGGFNHNSWLTSGLRLRDSDLSRQTLLRSQNTR